MTPRTGVLLGLAFLLLLAAPSALAAAKTVKLETTHASGAYIFRTVGSTDKNPTIEVDPGDTVTLNLTNNDPPANPSSHNFHATGVTGAVAPATGFITRNGTAQATFTIPADKGKEYTYVCDVHPSDMVGKIKVSGTADSGKSGTPGFTAALAFAAVAGAVLLLRRRA